MRSRLVDRLERVPLWVIPVALYVLAAATLLAPWPFGTLPPWAYNWEGYTAWRWATYWEPPVGPTFEIWEPNDGLMTDSGQGPLVGLPVALGIAAAGFAIEAFRVPVSLLAAAAVPLLWVFGRQVAGPGPALLAALLMAMSPAFLLYGRTATIVGVSLVPLLLTSVALGMVVGAPPDDGWRWRREGFLAVTLLLGIFSYAPVRLAWPLSIALLGFAAMRDRPRRKVLLSSVLLCLLLVPITTMALDQFAGADPDPSGAVLGYFHARGEQALTLRSDPAWAQSYLRDPSPPSEVGWETLRSLVGQNAGDLVHLLLDRGTNPVLTDYWNASGRFLPWFFAPFALVGAVKMGRGIFRGGIIPLLPLFLAAGLIVPLLLTSRVHVGRLLPALPFVLLLVANGVWSTGDWLTRRLHAHGVGAATRWVTPVLAAAILMPAIVLARGEWQIPVTPSRESLTAATLSAWHAVAAERGSAVLVEDPGVGDEIEQVRAATYRLDLDRQYRFVALPEDETTAGDRRPVLHWRGALAALSAGEIPQPCTRLWFVAPEAAVAFLEAWRDAGCQGAPESIVLP